ncbi:MAG: type VII secretion target [Kibdelosporangium sp.]
MSGGAFDVQIDQLLSHATTVADLANDARNAAATAQAALSGEAFGLIGQFLAAAILQATGDAKQGLAKAAQTIADVNTGLVKSARAYQEIDRRHAAFLARIKQEDK